MHRYWEVCVGTLLRRSPRDSACGSTSLRSMRRRCGVVAAVLVVSTAALYIPAALAHASSNGAAIDEAKRALIVLTDFPKGWKSSPSGSGNSGSNNLGVKQMTACLGVSQNVVNYNPPSANSPDFDQQRSGLSVNDDVEIFPNASVATQQFGLYSARRAPTCMAVAFNTPSVKSQFARQLGAGVTIGKVTSARLPSPHVPVRATSLSLAIPIRDSGSTVTISMTIVIIVSTLKGSELTFISPSGKVFPATLESRLDLLSAERLN